MINKIFKDNKALAFPTIIGLFCIFLGLAIWIMLDEVITPIQNVYVNSSFAYNQSDVYAGYINQGWYVLPFLLMIFGVIYILVNSQKQ